MIRFFYSFIFILLVSCSFNGDKKTTKKDYYSLSEIDSINLFFTDSEINELLRIDELFIDFITTDSSDIDFAFKNYLEQIIIEISEYGYYSCMVKSLIDFSNLQLISELSSSTYDKMYWKNQTYHIKQSDTLSVIMDAPNNKGAWLSFLKHYAYTDTLWVRYANNMENFGDYPIFIDSLYAYKDLLDFNKQTHRLIVLFHLIGQNSTWIYKDCE